MERVVWRAIKCVLCVLNVWCNE